MRLLVVLSSMIAIWTVTAAAESWKEYEYSDLGFAVSFPADPTMENLPYKAADGTTADEILYSVRQGPEFSASQWLIFPAPPSTRQALSTRRSICCGRRAKSA